MSGYRLVSAKCLLGTMISTSNVMSMITPAPRRRRVNQHRIRVFIRAERRDNRARHDPKEPHSGFFGSPEAKSLRPRFYLPLVLQLKV